MSNREQRRAMLKQEIDGVETEVAETALDAVDTYTPPPPPPAVLAAPAATALPAMTFEQLKELFAIMRPGQGEQGIGDQIAEAIRGSRQPIPEIPFGEYPAMSVFHPGGKDVPRPELIAKSYLGVWDDNTGKAIPVFPLDARQMTDIEIDAVNSMVPGSYQLPRNDGTTVQVRVVDIPNSMGTTERRVVAMPNHVYSKEHKNSLPPIPAMGQIFADQRAAG